VIKAVLADRQTVRRSRVGWFDDGACSLVFDQRVGRAQDCSCGMVDVSRYIVVGGGVCGLRIVVVSEWVGGGWYCRGMDDEKRG
jgi:hypothetical protein